MGAAQVAYSRTAIAMGKNEAGPIAHPHLRRGSNGVKLLTSVQAVGAPENGHHICRRGAIPPARHTPGPRNRLSHIMQGAAGVMTPQSRPRGRPPRESRRNEPVQPCRQKSRPPLILADYPSEGAQNRRQARSLILDLADLSG